MDEIETIKFREFNLPVLTIGHLKFVNGLPHDLVFDNGYRFKGNPEFAKLIKAESYFTPKFKVEEIVFGSIEYTKCKETYELIDQIKKEQKNLRIITSQITTNSIKDNIFVSPVITKETERSPPSEKICYMNKWNYNDLD